MSADKTCCCDVAETRGPLGNTQTVVIKCLPAALDLGHCEAPYEIYCCRKAEVNVR